MRILFISSFYPPYVVGGWEQLVEELNVGLQTRGHTTAVLTTDYGVGAAPNAEVGVQRHLRLESDLSHYRPLQIFTYGRRVKQNLQVARAEIESFKPDVIFIHIMWNLSHGVAWMAEQMLRDRVVYYVADHWLYSPSIHEQYWRDPARHAIRNALKQLAAPVALGLVHHCSRQFTLELKHVLCVSRAIRDAIIRHTAAPPENVSVVYNGVDTKSFAYRPRETTMPLGRLSLLFAGSLVPHKGVQTVIEALAILARQNALGNISLDIVGSGRADYETHLRNLVRQERLDQYVAFHGRVPRAKMPEVLNRFDVLILPSTWPEPLARITQEAMACGLAVIGTQTGGTGEILIEGETGLTFCVGDAAMLALRIKELHCSPDLMRQIACRARARVVRDFDIGRMLDQIEFYLSNVAGSVAPLHQHAPHQAE